MKVKSDNMKKILNPIQEFIHYEQSSGIILIFCTIVSLALANTPLNEPIYQFWHTRIGFATENIDLHKTILHWVNDGLMAVFFLLVGLEIKREIVSGELSSLRRASLPLFGAVGGMLVPALIYVSFNQGTIYENGWGVPMATDIAFALAILGLLGSRIPVSIKVFLTALAIIDDLGAIIVIALFYSSTLFLNYKAAALVTVLVLILINRLGIRSLAIYLGLGILLWYFVLKSGIHATIAGVILAMTIPYSKDETSSPLLALEHALHKPVQFFIMPIFALANTLIVMDASVWVALFSTLSIGIFTGLFFGKVCGILIFCWIGTKLNLAALPDGVTWHHLIGTGFLAGIGFTMSIFIAVLAFENQEGIQTTAKAAILTASIVSGLTGFMILRRTIKT